MTRSEVAAFRFWIIHNMLSGNLTIAKAEELQRMSDSQIMQLIRSGYMPNCNMSCLNREDQTAENCDNCPDKNLAEATAPPPVSPSKSRDGLARFSDQAARVDGAVVVVEKWGDHTYVAGPDRKGQVVLFVNHHDYFKIVFLRDILGVRLPPVNYQI